MAIAGNGGVMLAVRFFKPVNWRDWIAEGGEVDDYRLIQLCEIWDSRTEELLHGGGSTVTEKWLLCVSGHSRTACSTGAISEAELLTILTIADRAWKRAKRPFEGIVVPDTVPVDLGDETKGDER